MNQWQRLYESLHTPVPRNEAEEVEVKNPYEAIRGLTFDRKNPNSLIVHLGRRGKTPAILEQLSSEMWEQVNRIYLNLNQRSFRSGVERSAPRFFREVENQTFLFQGISGSSMMHDEGWRFIQIGSYLERTIATATLVDAHYQLYESDRLDPLPTDEYLQWVGLLKSCSAFEAYCRTYTPTLHTGNIAEFLLLNSVLPRSLHFCADRMHQAVQQIAGITGNKHSQRLVRLTGRLQAERVTARSTKFWTTACTSFWRM